MVMMLMLVMVMMTRHLNKVWHAHGFPNGDNDDDGADGDDGDGKDDDDDDDQAPEQSLACSWFSSSRPSCKAQCLPAFLSQPPGFQLY